jgi:hypothetical protein
VKAVFVAALVLISGCSNPQPEPCEDTVVGMSEWIAVKCHQDADGTVLDSRYLVCKCRKPRTP